MSRKQNSGNGIFLKIQGTSIHFTGSSYILAPNGGNNGVAKGKEFVQEVLGQLKDNLIEKKNEA
jgi:hypothetical protein